MNNVPSVSLNHNSHVSVCPLPDLRTELDQLLAEMIEVIKRRHAAILMPVMQGETQALSDKHAREPTKVTITSAAQTSEGSPPPSPRYFPDDVRFTPCHRQSVISAGSRSTKNQTLSPKRSHCSRITRSAARSGDHCRGGTESFESGISIKSSHRLPRILSRSFRSDTMSTKKNADDCVSLVAAVNFRDVFGRSHALYDFEKPVYRVEDHYHSIGWAQYISRDWRFSAMSLLMIVLNALFIGVEADRNDPDQNKRSAWIFTVCGYVFCAFFISELLVRFCAFRIKLDSLMDGWFRFDLLLVCIMVTELWLLTALKNVLQSDQTLHGSTFRLLRLLRLTRLTRLARDVPELITITKSIIAGLRAVLASAMFVLLLAYTFSIVLHNIMQEEDQMNNDLRSINRGLDTIPHCMWTLLLAGTFLDTNGDILSKLLFHRSANCIFASSFILLYILLSAITVMNMLIGVLCEVVVRMSQRERDDNEIRLLKNSILLHLKELDDGDGMIAKDEFFTVLHDPNSFSALKALNIDQLFLVELEEMLYPNVEHKVDIKAIMELMMMCRGDLPLTVKHIALLQACLISKINEVISATNDINYKLDSPIKDSSQHIHKLPSLSVGFASLSKRVNEASI